jgi:hypothetical protein
MLAPSGTGNRFRVSHLSHNNVGVANQNIQIISHLVIWANVLFYIAAAMDTIGPCDVQVTRFIRF